MKFADTYLDLHDWSISETGFHPDRAMVSESLFSLANEYMGVRAYFEEGYSGESLIGSYINGVYEEKFSAEKSAYKGISDRQCFMVNSVDWLSCSIHANGQKLDLAKSDFTGFSRSLDLRSGLLSRSFRWILSDGSSVDIEFQRLVSMKYSQKAYQRIVFTSRGFSGNLDVSMHLDFSRQHMAYKQNFWKAEESVADSGSMKLTAQSISTGQRVSAHSRLQVLLQDEPLNPGWLSTAEPGQPGLSVGLSAGIQLNDGENLCIEREATICHLNSNSPDMSQHSFAEALEENRQYWSEVWERSDIEIGSDPVNQQGIRYCIFQMEQTYRGMTPGANIGAKGLTGEAYSGNAFWDTETYCLPYYLFGNPGAAKQLLLYRYRTLPQAMERAVQLDCTGACYPIATIDGSESCTLWQHASTQFQPSTGVAFAIRHYMLMTGDHEFMLEMGLEMLIQISRFLVTRAQYSPRKKQWGFYGVMGPDEFQLMVNHNCYTNYLAKRSLEYCLEQIESCTSLDSDRFKAIVSKTGLSGQEQKLFAEVSSHMFIPREPGELIFEQHEGYFDLPHVDPSAIPVEEFPLYHSWSYDRIYRNDMIKQPDVLMFMFLYNQSFTHEEKRANFDFYEPRCIHESSLSPSVHSILAAELGDENKALELFGFATRIDLDNYNRNSREGLHVTAIAGAWMNIVYGFAGLRSDEKTMKLSPMLPSSWSHYRFRLLISGSRIEVTVFDDRLQLKLLSGEPVLIQLYGEDIRISAEISLPRRKTQPEEAHHV